MGGRDEEPAFSCKEDPWLYVQGEQSEKPTRTDVKNPGHVGFHAGRTEEDDCGGKEGASFFMLFIHLFYLIRLNMRGKKYTRNK